MNLLKIIIVFFLQYFLFRYKSLKKEIDYPYCIEYFKFHCMIKKLPATPLSKEKITPECTARVHLRHQVLGNSKY